MARGVVVILACAMCLVGAANARCPLGYGVGDAERVPVDSVDAGARRNLQAMPEVVDFEAVSKDLMDLMTDSQAFWPADFGSYAGFLIRQAWHCAGSYRASDGRGGCDGGRQRFEPELSWPDNGNLDKGKTLLLPIKLKYGSALSWGDLMILAGNVAIQSGGGPVLGFCGGRIDDVDGTSSLELGRSLEQEQVAPCPTQGDCPWPLGPSVITNIYVDPAGFMGNPDPGEATAADIRGVFGRMNFNDTETVALVGGGHAFGKMHGPCDASLGGAGLRPVEDPFNPWAGSCGEGEMMGIGENTFTSGFDGPWTTRPTEWTNEYFTNLMDYEWTLGTGPSGAPLWFPNQKEGGSAPPADIRMLTTDVANIVDPSYLNISTMFADDIEYLNEQFAAAWYKLTTQDMGPVERCVGNLVPPAQPFQNPLPKASGKKVNYDKVRKAIVDLLTDDTKGDILEPDVLPDDGGVWYGAQFVYLAYQCASTFRATDYRGGCNGARIRFPPQSQWPANTGMDQVLMLLGTVKDMYPDISWADLIVLAGTTALEESGMPKATFCGGRVDADPSSGSGGVHDRDWYPDPFVAFRDNMRVMGLDEYEAIALMGRIRSPVQQMRLNLTGSWTRKSNRLSTNYFTTLITKEWTGFVSGDAMSGFKYSDEAFSANINMTAADMAIVFNTTWHSVAQDFSSNKRDFFQMFRDAWTKLMNADRYDGPTGNLCGEATTGAVMDTSDNFLVSG